MSQGTRAGAWGIGACLVAMGLVGCGKDEVQAPAEPKVATPVAADWPAEPVVAFRPAREGACPASYRLQDDTCVHVAMRGRVSDTKLEAQLEAYRAGAASPRVGGGPAPLELAEPVVVDPLDVSNLPPDALTTKRLDATKAKEERLRQLDEMILAARIRAGEVPDPLAPAPSAASPARKKAKPANDAVAPAPAPSEATSAAGDTKTLSEMTEGLPPEVLRALLVDIQRNGGAQIVPPEELEALQRRVGYDDQGQAEPDEIAQPAEPSELGN